MQTEMSPAEFKEKITSRLAQSAYLMNIILSKIGSIGQSNE